MSRIIIRRYRIALPRKVPKPTAPIRIVVIGDLHNRTFGKGNRNLVEQIVGQHPDLIFSVGDLTICKPGKETNIDVAVSLLKRLSCECPVYCINGNHEFRAKRYPDAYNGVYEEFKKGIHTSNIRLLEDEKEQINIKGTHLTVHGYELPEKYYKRFQQQYISAEEIRKSIQEPEEGRYNILLAHNPVYFEGYALWGADLTLSGHLHGGLMRLPLIGGVISPQVKLFPKYDCGLYEKYGRKLLVTAGLGSHSIAFRINNPAEFMLVELY